MQPFIFALAHSVRNCLCKNQKEQPLSWGSTARTLPRWQLKQKTQTISTAKLNYKRYSPKTYTINLWILCTCVYFEFNSCVYMFIVRTLTSSNMWLCAPTRPHRLHDLCIPIETHTSMLSPTNDCLFFNPTIQHNIINLPSHKLLTLNIIAEHLLTTYLICFPSILLLENMQYMYCIKYRIPILIHVHIIGAILTAPWWLAEVVVISPASSMLVDGTWTKLKSQKTWGSSNHNNLCKNSAPSFYLYIL